MTSFKKSHIQGLYIIVIFQKNLLLGFIEGEMFDKISRENWREMNNIISFVFFVFFFRH